LENAPSDELELSGLTISQFGPDNNTVKNDLILDLIETGGGLNATLIYNADLYEVSTVKQILTNFETILRIVVEQPDIRLSELDAQLAEAERQQQLLVQEEFKAARQKLKKSLKAKNESCGES
jgi:hypothetical protein